MLLAIGGLEQTNQGIRGPWALYASVRVIGILLQKKMLGGGGGGGVPMNPWPCIYTGASKHVHCNCIYVYT